MILGRNTMQWVGVIAATLSFIKLGLELYRPELAGTLNILIPALTGLLALWITFLANTSTTPVNDPQLVENTMVRITDVHGRMIGHVPVGLSSGAAPDEGVVDSDIIVDPDYDAEGLAEDARDAHA